jgi:hypothetical protein
VESVLVLIAILALVGGSATLLLRQGALPWTLPMLRMSGGATEPAASPDDGEALTAPGGELALLTPAIAAQPMPVSAHEAKLGPADPVRLDLIQTPGDGVSVRLDRIETRLHELQRDVARQRDQVAEEARQFQAELILRAEAEEARRDAAQERLRGDLLALIARAVPERQSGTNSRRMDVSTELYAQLAKLEAALATVTNPILLPGEPYAPPAELLPESFVWENWNEVGERSFALAEVYSAQRLHLSAQTRDDVGAFITTLRTLLTRSVYPHVQGEIDGPHQEALRAALAEIAAELPKVRDLLETEYLEGRSG